ncbi:MAG: FAD-dependent oxidoreductase [Myxococcota bacterium]
MTALPDVTRVMNRRSFLAGSLASTGLAACGRPPERPALVGADASSGLAGRGHRWQVPFAGGAGGTPEGAVQRADVVIVGAGAAGLSAAWRLAGQGLSVRLLELWSAPGGTAIAGTGARGPYPWGAHYLTLPGPDALHVRRLLRDVGVITGADAAGRPLYHPDALCLAPEERIWDAGLWIEGLWPEAHAEPEDRRQHDAWVALVASWSARVGADGRPAFTIPVSKSSQDPDIRALVDVPFSVWLDALGFTAPVLRWWLEYATRDDYGTTLADTSAWAGLHYFCARRPDPGDARDLGTHVLTWPAGNGWLVEQLVARAGVPVETGAVVRSVEVEEGRVRVWAEVPSPTGEARTIGIEAGSVILAVPTRLAKRLLTTGPLRDMPDSDLPDQAPWRVAQLQVSALPTANGVPTAWDSVVYGAESLGYVTSTHQAGNYGGPGVLTWYQPLLGDPLAARRKLLDEPWEAARDLVLDDLGPSHPDLLDVLERLDVWHWGHGTVRPVPGLHRVGRLEALQTLHPRVHLAHTDLSGLSLFEEASFHGIRAAEAVLTLFGRPADTWM